MLQLMLKILQAYPNATLLGKHCKNLNFKLNNNLLIINVFKNVLTRIQRLKLFIKIGKSFSWLFF